MSSSHSRSSSEILSYQYTDVLPVFFKAFKENFDFDDVKDDVKDIFTKEEYQSILSESDEQHQLVRLFSVLGSRELLATQFLERIKPYYGFLCEAIKRERDSPQKSTLNYVDIVHMWRTSHPKHTDYNVLRMEWHVRLRNALRKLKPFHSVVLQGDLGMGKKWLTLGVCYDYDVMKAMNFQIFWLDVSDCNSPEQDLNRLQTLRLMLGGTSNSHSPTFSSSPNSTGAGSVCNAVYQDPSINESISNRKLALQQYLRKKLTLPEYRNCLLILKDVQNFKTVQAFNLGFKLLVITRNKKVSESLSSKMSTHLLIDSGLTKAEFYTLFEKYLKPSRERFPKQAIEIYEYSKGHPHLLSIIAQNLRQRRSNLDEWIRNLKNFEINDNKFTKVVEISLNVLQPELLELYAVFGIFPHSVPLPVRLLAALWNKSQHDADEIVQRFHKFSFVNKERCNPISETNNDDDDGDCCCCVLPFIYSSHLRASKRMKDLINSQQLHRKVIDYYKLGQTFSQRTEIDLCNSEHDWYFFNFIGYHLQAAGQHEALFPLIYLDFGFLEQKIRAVGLSNTISDLKFFENEITNHDPRKRELLAELREFLPKVEEKLTASEDTSLLQYALMASGNVYEEAELQIRQFAQRVWFSERGNFHKRRQIVNLAHQAKFVRLLDQDLCLIVLANNDMMLLDISLDCTHEPVMLKNDEFKNSVTIIEARLFRENNYILTLDTAGALKIWSIVDDHRHSIVQRRSSRQKVHALNSPAGNRTQSGRRYKQRIQENSMGQHGFIVAFFIEQCPPNYGNDTNLHVAFSNGDISVFKWNKQREEFTAEKVPILKTQANDIRFLCKLLNTYYMLLTKSGDIAFWYLRDGSKSYIPFEWPKCKTGPISYELYNFHHCTLVIIVFADKVMSLIFENKEFIQQPNAIVKQIYANREDGLKKKNNITCAKLSADQRYLVLGTKRGLIVYDVHSESEVLRSNVSESIACLDIYPLDDKIFKYVIICGSEHRRCLNIFAMRTNEEQGITWAHNVTSMGNQASSDPQLEADVWLLGQKLYDVYYKEDGTTQLVAVDSKYRVHQVNTTKTKSWSIIMPRETSEPITSITTGNEMAFVGYNNGDIFNISKDVFETESMKGPITYLQIFDDTYIVASTAKETSIRNVNLYDTSQLKIKNYEFGTKKCYKAFEHYLLLISEQGILSLIDLKDEDYDIKFVMHGLQPSFYGEKLCSCDYQNEHLILATVTLITIFKIKCDNEQTTVPKVLPVGVQTFNNANTTTDPLKTLISTVTLSKDAGLIAIGFTNGDIEIYKMRDTGVDYIYRLQSHRARINDIKFSLGNEVLASCAEQLCFWSVPYLLNNPLTTHSPKRRSSRFSSQRSSDIEEVDARVITPCGSNGGCNIASKNFLNVPTPQNGHLQSSGVLTAMGNLQLEEAARLATAKAWCDKRGPADKPELLACIKFDGNKAEKLFANPDFTQFNTIDDEGVYYHLALLKVTGANESKLMSIKAMAIVDVVSDDGAEAVAAGGGADVVSDFTVIPWRVSTGADDLSNGEDEVYT